MLAILPFFHVYGMTLCLLYGLWCGAEIVVMPRPRPIDHVMKILQRTHASVFPGVPTLYTAINHHPRVREFDLSSVKICLSGSAPLPMEVQQQFEALTGGKLVEGYGLSETSPVLTCNRGDISEWTGTIGLPLPSTEISIRDDTGRELPIGEQGEICARGPQVMAGYWKRPDETAKAMTEDGFFRTGDVGMMDEQGRVRIVDRKKDMISVSGFKVFPNEVEEVAMSHGGLLECAVVGVPDKHSGEVGKLYAVRKKPDVTADDLRAFLAARLASYKVPKQIEFRDELPKTNVGKILRRALRDEPSQPAAN